MECAVNYYKLIIIKSNTKLEMKRQIQKIIIKVGVIIKMKMRDFKFRNEERERSTTNTTDSWQINLCANQLNYDQPLTSNT